MQLFLSLSLVSLCGALSISDIFGSSSTTPYSTYNSGYNSGYNSNVGYGNSNGYGGSNSRPSSQAQNDFNRQDGQWVWVPNSALRDVMNTNSFSSSYGSGSTFGSGGYNSGSYGYNNNGMRTTTSSSFFG